MDAFESIEGRRRVFQRRHPAIIDAFSAVRAGVAYFKPENRGGRYPPEKAAERTQRAAKPAPAQYAGK
jgi:hypothetical protein